VARATRGVLRSLDSALRRRHPVPHPKFRARRRAFRTASSSAAGWFRSDSLALYFHNGERGAGNRIIRAYPKTFNSMMMKQLYCNIYRQIRPHPDPLPEGEGNFWIGSKCSLLFGTGSVFSSLGTLPRNRKRFLYCLSPVLHDCSRFIYYK
jgi:hypothetical protein